MKKITLFATAALLSIGTAKASEKAISSEANYPVNVNAAEPIVFLERGVEFYVFADGQFDFNTVSTASGNSQTTYYYRGHRTTVNTTYGAPGVSNGGIRIEHDANGRIRRIGNVFMNYDVYGRIKRIGSVYMSYNQFALSQVGGLQIRYDRWGRIIGTFGQVNTASFGYQPQAGNPGGHSYQLPGNGNSYGSDDDFYYYKQDGTKEKMDVKK